MATTSNPGGESDRPAATTESKPAPRPTTARRTTGKTTARKSTSGTASKSTSGSVRRSTSTSARRKRPRTPVEQAQAMAERAVLVPLGAGVIARDNLIGTVKGLATKYTTRSGLQREIRRYERRGVTERNRFERQVRQARSHFQSEVRQRRSNVEKTVRENRRRFEREVRSVRKDLEKQSGAVSQRVDKLVSDAQGLIGNSAS